MSSGISFRNKQKEDEEERKTIWRAGVSVSIHHLAAELVASRL